MKELKKSFLINYFHLKNENFWTILSQADPLSNS